MRKSGRRRRRGRQDISDRNAGVQGSNVLHRNVLQYAPWRAIMESTMPDDISPSTPVSLRVPTELLEDIDRIAQTLDRPRSWVMLRALRACLEAEGAEVIEDAAALAELDRGEGIPADDVLLEMDEIIRGC